MARIQLRDTDIYIQDGLSGTSRVNEVTGALASPAESTTTPGVAATTDEVQEIEQYAVNFTGGTFTLTFNLDGESPFTTAAIAYNANAATVETAIDVAATLAGVTGWTNGDITVSGGPLTAAALVLTFDGASVAQTNQGQTTINGALLTSTALNGALNLDIDTNVLNTDDTDLVPIGARFTVAGDTAGLVHTVTGRTGNPTTNVVFTPALGSTGLVLDNAVITWLPQRVTVKIGEGDMAWTETKEFIYDRDRDLLDTVREGQEQPVEVEMAFIFDYVTTESGQLITPVDALKRIGEATEWVSSSSDQCEPYAVDIYVLHCVPCGTDEDQDFLFQDFRWESLEYSIQDASIAVSGRCNVSNVVTTRADLC